MKLLKESLDFIEKTRNIIEDKNYDEEGMIPVWEFNILDFDKIIQELKFKIERMEIKKKYE